MADYYGYALTMDRTSAEMSERYREVGDLYLPAAE